MYIGGAPAGDDAMSIIAERWGGTLIDLRAGGAGRHLTGIGTGYIAENSKSLTSIDLTGCAVGDEDIATLLSKCPKLHALEITSCRSLSRHVRISALRPHGSAALRAHFNL